MTVNVRPGAKSPLDGATHGRDNAVLLKEVPFTPGYDVRVDPASPAYGLVCEALGLRLPTRVGRTAASDDLTAMAIGPDWWLVTGTRDVAALLEPLRAEHHLSVVDVSAQRTTIELCGPHALDVLEHLWEQDLRPEHFPVGRCAQGILAKTPVILWHCDTDCYCLFVRSSFARHAWQALTDATVEYL